LNKLNKLKDPKRFLIKVYYAIFCGQIQTLNKKVNFIKIGWSENERGVSYVFG
jgi:hypothetical protein